MYVHKSISKWKNNKTYTSYLLCQKYRENWKWKLKTLANLSMLPKETILAIKESLSNKNWTKFSLDSIWVEKSIDYGYFYLIIETLKKLKIYQLIQELFQEGSSLILLMIIWKLITKWSKLAIVNRIKRNSVLAEKLEIDLKTINEKQLYWALIDAQNIQKRFETEWFKTRTNKNQTIYLYDITSSYFEWTKNELSEYWYNRDKKRWKKQVNIWLVTDENWFPLKIQAFKWNTLDYKTVSEQIKNIKSQFWANKIILVWDRWMKIKYNVDEIDNNQENDIDYISALTNNEIKTLEDKWKINISLFDKDIVEIKEDWKRYLLCRNPFLAEELKIKRNELRDKFEEKIVEIKWKYNTRKQKCEENREKLKNWHKNKLVTEINEKYIRWYEYDIQYLLKKYKLTKFYSFDISNKHFKIEFNIEAYKKQEAMDGNYIIETSVEEREMTKEEIIEKYKSLQKVEHAFRDLKSNEIQIRPIYHIKGEQTRWHIFISMIAYAVVYELESKILPWLNEDEQKKEKLSYKDIIDELKSIKYTVLNFDNVMEKVYITKFTDMQKKILNLFWIKNIPIG